MPYGILKADTLTYYTASGDISIPVSGIAATVSGTIAVPSGTQAAPSISYVGDPDTGFYSPGANQVAIATSGTGRLFVDADGKVGIGTSSPATELHVAGATRIGADGTNDASLELGAGATGNRSAYIDLIGDTTYADFGLRVAREGTGANAVSEIVHRGTGELRIKAFDAAPITFFTGSAERARIDSSGRLLVGTSTSVNTKYDGSAFAADFQLASTGAGAASFSRYGANTDGSVITFNKSRGSLNVQTSVIAEDTLGYIGFTGSDGTNLQTAASIRCLVDGTPGTNDMPGRLVFSTTADGSSSPTERMRISSSGVVTIKNGAVAEIGTLTDGATITPDFAANCNFTVTISGNRTMANPTNITAGQAGSVFIVQGSGSNTLGWGSYWDFPSGTAPTLSTASGAVDRVDYIVRTATSIHTVFTANYS